MPTGKRKGKAVATDADSDGEDIEKVTGKDGYRPLHKACRAGDVAEVTRLIAAGADLKTKTKRGGIVATTPWPALPVYAASCHRQLHSPDPVAAATGRLWERSLLDHLQDHCKERLLKLE